MSSKKNGEEIGILGMGFVGSVLKKYYPKALVFDIKKGVWDPIRKVLSQKIIFLTINIHDNGRSDITLTPFRAYLNDVPKGRIIVIKSTLVPGTAEILQREYPDLKICYNPEFLTEATAWEDFRNPQFQILGVTDKSRRIANKLFEVLPDAPLKKIIGAREAETLKHAINSYYSMKVVFFNELYDACERIDADYEEVRRIMVENPFIGNSHSQVWHKGYRGFGGKCLPKDVSAFASISQSSLLIKVIQINEMLTSSRGRPTEISDREKIDRNMERIVAKS